MDVNSAIKALAATAIVVSILTLVVIQGQSVKNQRLQMKQQFHSDFIALVSLFGEDGLNKLLSAETSKELTKKEIFATGLLLQRFLVAYRMKDAWTAEEWKYIEKDIRAAMKSFELLRSRWQQIREWYPESDRKFLDEIVK